MPVKLLTSGLSTYFRIKGPRSRALGIVLLCTGTLVSFWSCCKKVPPGHVGILKDWNGKVYPYLYDDSMTFFFVPIFQNPVSFRVLPVTRRMTKVFTTKDLKVIEVVLQLKLQPKIAHIPEIYMRFGRDYCKDFLESEATQDLYVCIKNSTCDDLVHNDERTDRIVDTIVDRFKDACAFNRIELLESSIIFRTPQESTVN